MQAFHSLQIKKEGRPIKTLMLLIMNSTRRLGRVFIVISAAAFLAGCITNPYTNRSQLVLFTDDNKEMALGIQAQDQILKNPNLRKSQDPVEIAAVQRVSQRIIEAAKRSKYAERAQKFQWEVNVIKADNTVNAMVLPGGKIFVYTGIFPVAFNDAGLAAILGHEVTHALALHSSERRSQGILVQGVAIVAGVAAASQGIDPGLAQTGVGALAQLGVLLPYSRAHESEADYIGLLLAADAGYDPHEAVRVWERMERMSKSQPLQFLSTHPSNLTRVKQMEGWMAEAVTYYRPVTDMEVQQLPPIGGNRSGSPMGRHKTSNTADLSSVSSKAIEKDLVQWRDDLDHYVLSGKLTEEEATKLYMERKEFLASTTQRVPTPRAPVPVTVTSTMLRPGSVAEQAGARVGDIIRSVNGTPVANEKELNAILGPILERLKKENDGQPVTFGVDRDGQHVELTWNPISTFTLMPPAVAVTVPAPIRFPKETLSDPRSKDSDPCAPFTGRCD